jgi:hypothetical protein
MKSHNQHIMHITQKPMIVLYQTDDRSLLVTLNAYMAHYLSAVTGNFQFSRWRHLWNDELKHTCDL